MSPASPAEAPPGWHALHAEEVGARLGTGPHGLTAEEATRRLAIHGPNRLDPPPRPGPLRWLLRQFDNALIWALLVAAAVTALLGHLVDAGVILGVVVVNAVIGAVQEGRAEQALAALRDLLAPSATVIRADRRETVPAEALVPGDLVMLRSGDRVAADLRLIATTGLQIDESVLTGESVPADKDAEPVVVEAPVAERTGMAFAGTLVTQGRGRGIVVATGKTSEIGRIGAMLGTVSEVTTPLLRKLDAFGRSLTVAILALGAAALLVGVLVHGRGWGEMFLAAVGLAVAAIPEGLPAILTITLAIGVTRMARRHAIIRQLPAVETLGSVTVICSDKTGTLTRNELRVTSLQTAVSTVDTSDAAWRPDPADPAQAQALRGCVLCNDADLRVENGSVRVLGNPMDAALLSLAHRAGVDIASLAGDAPRHGHLPFESAHKFMATLHRSDRGCGIWAKGAPERLIDTAGLEWGPAGARAIDRPAWHARVEHLAAQGQRVLALALQIVPNDTAAIDHGALDERLVLVALVGVLDPPRTEAIEAIALCRSAGIRVVMITGDHVATASAIATQLGLGARTLDGKALDAMDDQALALAVREVDVFARTTPAHKLRLVRALQAQGEIVAMTGDGVNDAPALKRAEVGIAMGIKGTEAAKEAAVMVLADDDFASIAQAVEQGRTVYANLRKSLLFVLPTNGGQAMVVLVAMLMGWILPLTPVQVLWVNMISAVTLALALAFDPAEPDTMRRPPRPPSEPILDRLLIWRVIFVSVLLMLLVYAVFAWRMMMGDALDAARTAAVNALVLGQIAYLLNCRHIVGPSWTVEGLFGNRVAWLAITAVLALQLGFTYVPAMDRLFATHPVELSTWMVTIAGAVLLGVVVEVEKLVSRRLAGA